MNRISKILSILYLLLLILGCSSIEPNDKQEILSKVFYEQIGKYEHFGSSPPLPAVPPNFEELKEFSSQDSAQIYLKSDEWKDYFVETEQYEEKVKLWRSRMLSIEKKIVFYNKYDLTEHEKVQIKEVNKKYNIGLKPLENTTNWGIQDIANNSLYDLIEYEEYKASELDSVHVGSMKFSNIGFTEDKKLAIIYYDWFCGSLCGERSVAILEKKMNNWTIKEIINLAVS